MSARAIQIAVARADLILVAVVRLARIAGSILLGIAIHKGVSRLWRT